MYQFKGQHHGVDYQAQVFPGQVCTGWVAALSKDDRPLPDIEGSLLRNPVSDRNDVEAIREISSIWKREISAFPPLMATLIDHARNELHLPFDKEQFEAGLIDSNARIFAELERVIGPPD